MERKRIVLGLIGLAASTCEGKELVVGNATELRTFLLTSHVALAIQPLNAQRGCGPNGCSIDLGGISILRDKGALLDAANKKPILIRAQTPGKLPEIDWDPLAAFAVQLSGKPWGTCLELPHAGLGKSGRFQRWSSVLLIPWQDSKPSPSAYRFVGYWAGCDVLSEGNRPGEVGLATLEPVTGTAGNGLQILWHSCGQRGCTTAKDNNKVIMDSSSESGALKIKVLP